MYLFRKGTAHAYALLVPAPSRNAKKRRTPQMILDQDREAITRLAEHYSITRLLLFGSSIDPTREGRDIDLAVEGLPPQDFFRFYGDLLFSVSKPVDLIDLSQNSKLTRQIRKEGLPLYEAAQKTR